MAGRLPRRKIKQGDRINTGVLVDAFLWKDFRIYCERNNLLLGEKLDQILKEFLRVEQQKIPNVRGG